MSYRNPTLGTSIAILCQRTISSERPQLEPLPTLDSEHEEEDAAPARSPSPSPPPGLPSFASSPSGHKPRESPKKDSRERKDKREKRKRRDRDSSSSPTSQRRKSRSSSPRVSREEASSLSTQFRDLVNSLPDMFTKLFEAKFPDNSPPSRSSFNQLGAHTLPDDPGFLNSRPASPDPNPPSTLEQNQPSAPDPQPPASLAPAPALTSVTTPAPGQASQLDRTSPVPSTSASPPEGATIQFLPVTWTDIPKTWQPSFLEGKIRVSAPDPSHPSGFSLRSDVLLKMSTDEEGETTFLYERKPSSVLMPAPPPPPQGVHSCPSRHGGNTPQDSRYQ
ncbi:hypothetical protein Pmani_024571 [Petrolisthes manimaculis]|uniref:Uncharacterized protein n=1 Tax=Petrolisthes manimaculis TaxID=1843537 RepID=A0AAE1TZ86_9EUCA|nr:hypothetical protein Pmani_024571 [Petrolisthes manimaculis]